MLGEISFYDVIQAEPLTDGTLRFLKIATPSGLKTNSWILPKGIIESGEFRAILDDVMELDGNWEQVFGGLLLVHLPEQANTIEARIKDFRPS